MDDWWRTLYSFLNIAVAPESNTQNPQRAPLTLWSADSILLADV